MRKKKFNPDSDIHPRIQNAMDDIKMLFWDMPKIFIWDVPKWLINKLRGKQR